VKVILLCRSCIRRDVRKWHSSDAVIIRREGRITGLEQTHLQLTPTAAPAPEEIKSPPRWAPQLNVGAYQSSDRVRPRTGTTDRWALGNQMPSSCGQPIILSVITMDLAPAASMNASTPSATPASCRVSAPSENHRLRSCGLGMLRRYDADVSLVAARSSGP